VSANISYWSSQTAGPASRSCRYTDHGSSSAAPVYGSRSDTGTAPADVIRVVPGNARSGARQIRAARRPVGAIRRRLTVLSAVNMLFIRG
jgi:hypothetical protein